MNWHELFNMHGYGLYIWPAYCLTFFVFSINLCFVRWEKKQVKKIIRQYYESQTKNQNIGHQ